MHNFECPEILETYGYNKIPKYSPFRIYDLGQVTTLLHNIYISIFIYQDARDYLATLQRRVNVQDSQIRNLMSTIAELVIVCQSLHVIFYRMMLVDLGGIL